MKSKIMIPNRQFSILVTMSLIGTTILIIPHLVGTDAKQDAWMSAIITFVAAVPLILLYTRLYYLYPGNTFTQLFQVACGKWMGKILAAVYLLTFPLIINSLSLRNVGDFLVTQIMPETPIEAIHIIVMLVAVYAVHLGIEAIARIGELLIPITMFFLIIMFIMLIPNINLDFLFPVFEHGFKPVLQGSLTFYSFPFMEGVMYIMVMPLVKEQKKLFKAYFTGILIGWFILFVTTLFTILVLGPFITSNEVFPSFVLAKSIAVPNILERTELTIAIAWFITSFFRVCFYFYCVVAGLSQLFNVTYHWIINFFAAIATVVISVTISRNINLLLNFDQTLWPIVTGVCGLALPLLLFVVLLIKRSLRKG